MSWRTPFSRPRRRAPADFDPFEPVAARERWTRRVVRVLASICGVLLLLLGGWLVYQWITWPDVRALATQDPETTAFIERYRERRREAGVSDQVAWRWISDERISPHLKRAVVAAEDLEFFGHHGFSVSEMRAAMRQALAEGDLRGASTITQQLAKNLWLTPSRNPWRKVKEALLTRQLEKHLSKRRILELYLNVAEFGQGVYGVGAAAERYFGKAASHVTEHEAAMLAASLPRPSQWHPGRDSPGYHRYVSQIETRMARATFLWRHVAGVGAAMPESSLDAPSMIETAVDSTAITEAVPDSAAIAPSPATPGGATRGGEAGVAPCARAETADRVVSEMTTLVVRLRTPHGPYLAVRDPDGVLHFVIFPSAPGDPVAPPAMVDPDAFADASEISFVVDTLRGWVWGSAESWTPVFRRPGLYTISVGDSLETASPSVDLRLRVLYCP